MKKFSYQKYVRDTKNWLESSFNRERMHNQSRDKLKSYLSNRKLADSLEPIGPLNPLGQYAAWTANIAVIEIAHETGLGWQQLFQFYYNKFRVFELEISAKELRGKFGPQNADPTLNPFHLLGMALTFRRWNDADYLGAAMLEGRNSMLLGGTWCTELRYPFCCYLYELYQRSVGQPGFPDDFGPYAGIFTNWDNPAGLREAILQACDYHVEQCEDPSPDEFGVFAEVPYYLFPSEILALYRVREKLGLETPPVSHPLLDTPFAEVPADLSYEPDPLVEEAFRVANERLPEVVAKQLRR